MAERIIDKKEIGYRIKTLRMRQGISQTDFAKMIDVSQTHMSNIEGGNAGLTLENLVKMANIFDCGIDNIVFGESKRNIAQDFDALGECTVKEFLNAVQMLKGLK